MKKKHMLILFGMIILVGLLLPSHIFAAKGKPTYIVTPSSSTYNNNFTNYTTYNKKTKHYYLLRSYLEQLEKTGGGTLVLKKGTYTISNTLYVPSNVTIKLKNGVKIVKGTDSGTKKFSASKSIFQFIRPTLSKETGVYGGYDGEKNISIIGEGTASIDLKYDHDSLALIIGHNQNILIENIDFKNMYSGHFIEIDATKDAVIQNNTFRNSKASAKENKEAINLDTPDKSTLGWSQKWSKFDKTPNSSMLIENNDFYNLDRAIGTHKYSGNQFHDQIIIKNNTIEKMRKDAIRVMNWSNSVIEDNTIKDVAPSSGHNNRGILASGAINPTFKNNMFVDMPRPMQFMAWKNNGHGSQYDITYNELNDKNISDLSSNTVVEYDEDFIRINHEYQKYDKTNTDYIPVQTALFSDFNEKYSGYEETVDLVEKNIINGYQDYTFRPYQSISREHVALLLYNALDLKAPSNLDKTLKVYKDVNSNYYYAKEIAAVTEAKIFGGSSGEFIPNQTITRSQMASVLVRAYKLKETNSDVNLVDLDKIDQSHRRNVKILAQNDITIGKPYKNNKRYFDGTDSLNRAQFSIFLHRSMELRNTN